MMSVSIHKIRTLSMSSADYMPFLVTRRDGVPA